MFGLYHTDGLVEELSKVCPGRVSTDVLLSGLTTFRIGGPADLVVEPASVDQLKKVLVILSEREEKYVVIGRGSNILACDDGFRGVVVRIGEAMQQVSKQNAIIVAQAGASLSSLARTCVLWGRGGLEFAAGIPGTVGGALYMNAGAYGGEMKQVVQEVTAVDQTGRLFRLDKVDMQMGYRRSILQRKSWIAVECALQLEERDPLAVKALIKKYNQQRRDKQPLEYPSAGSVFKRPEGYYAGRLIEQAGLKGLRIGGAQISPKHAGFIVNRGGATCSDVLELIRQAQKRVYENSGVSLEPEIRYLSARGLDQIQ